MVASIVAGGSVAASLLLFDATEIISNLGHRKSNCARFDQKILLCKVSQIIKNPLFLKVLQIINNE